MCTFALHSGKEDTHHLLIRCSESFYSLMSSSLEELPLAQAGRFTPDRPTLPQPFWWHDGRGDACRGPVSAKSASRKCADQSLRREGAGPIPSHRGSSAGVPGVRNPRDTVRSGAPGEIPRRRVASIRRTLGKKLQSPHRRRIRAEESQVRGSRS